LSTTSSTRRISSLRTSRSTTVSKTLLNGYVYTRPLLVLQGKHEHQGPQLPNGPSARTPHVVRKLDARVHTLMGGPQEGLRRQLPRVATSSSHPSCRV